MLKNDSVKRVHKNFTNFKEEEDWLQFMLLDGWVLAKYKDEFEDGTYYTFNLHSNEKQSNLIYKVDFRDFNRKKDFLEYKEIFEDSGWNILSKKGNSKHIFFTKSQNPNISIFSDADSYKEREKRAIRSSLTSGGIAFIFLVISIYLYSIYEKSAFLAGGAFTIITGIKYIIRYFRHRKILKSLL